MKVRSWMGGIAVMTLCSAGSAFAAVNATQVGNKVNFNQERAKVGLDARAGAGGFTGSAGTHTAPGALLGITAVAQPWRLLGVETGVEGQRLPIDDARVGNKQSLYRYNADILVKPGVLVVKDILRPYVGAGAGLTYVNATDGAEPLYRNDFIVELPLAAGMDVNITKNITAGARASYNVLFGTEFANGATSNGKTGGNLLNFSGTVGGRF